MKIESLSQCVRNSWCVEKHWEAILRVLAAAKDMTKETAGRTERLALWKAISDLEAIP